MESLKNAIKKIPGSKWVADKIRKSRGNNASGDWLYTQEIVQWLYRPELKKQLPAPYRFFSTYAAMQKPFLAHQIFGGARVLKAAMSLNKFSNGSEFVGLDLGTYKVFLNLRDPRMLQVPNELLQESDEVAIFKTYLSNGDTFVDVGANHGSFSIIASKLVGVNGFLCAVEPQPQMAALVEKSLAANAECKFQVHNFACGDRNGEVEFYIPDSTSGTAGVFPGFSATAPHRKLTVPLKRFDDEIDWNAFPGKIFLKLDVEGSELAFLRGAGAMISARHPQFLLEINPKSSRAAGVTVESTIRFLQEMGYEHFIELKNPLKQILLREIDTTRQRNVIILAQN